MALTSKLLRQSYRPATGLNVNVNVNVNNARRAQLNHGHAAFMMNNNAAATPPSTRAYTLSSYLVTPSQLSHALSANPPSAPKLSTSPRTIPVCGSWFLPNDPSKRTGRSTYLKGPRIPSSRFFDLDKVCDTSSAYPHMLPSPELFAEAMREMGIRRDDEVVIYDTQELGIFSAPRVGWTFRVFGHPKVHVLNNFRVWVEEGRELDEKELDESALTRPETEKTDYPVPALEKSMVASFEEVKEIAEDWNKEGAEGVQVLDARSEGRWRGTEPEPRPGLSSGHIPGSFSVPVGDLLDPRTKAFLSADELRKVLERKGIDESRPVVNSCGTGVTAAVIDAALEQAAWGSGQTGVRGRRLYDGSWT